MSHAAKATRQTPPIVPHLLQEYGRATRARLDRWLSVETPAPYLDALLADYPSRGGKSMRPAILIATARIAGASLDDVLDAAVAVELFHNAQLVHDDIEDGSDLRRGAPTLHKLHGVPLALNAGSAAMLLAFDPLIAALRRRGADRLERGLALTRRVARDAAEGQALELGWRENDRLDLDDADYFRMALRKTAATSVIWPAQLGLLLGRTRPIDPDAIGKFGGLLGLAFQIQDDLLNLVADRAYGKEPLGDLREGKRTLIVLHAARTARGDDRRLVMQWCSTPVAERSDALLCDLADCLTRVGSVAHAERTAHALAGAAGYELERALGDSPPSEDRDFLHGLVPWVFERT
ncbi:polyprenyl synthetase family protein [Sphingomonas sp. SUN019]|uniref:polyprenyl synthetase family protein n=1 Tax=Sphingomonas sp. SUN019 TaxID=2937788 RepID=UPI00216445AA|nr:polyprenyl synthetase family protein [Sphingomonas sp. SUN019]UVO51743.1 polyprenyl synthetase family protein [Sphingomonas sp. SUN019]